MTVPMPVQFVHHPSVGVGVEVARSQIVAHAAVCLALVQSRVAAEVDVDRDHPSHVKANLLVSRL